MTKRLKDRMSVWSSPDLFTLLFLSYLKLKYGETFISWLEVQNDTTMIETIQKEFIDITLENK